MEAPNEPASASAEGIERAAAATRSRAEASEVEATRLMGGHLVLLLEGPTTTLQGKTYISMCGNFCTFWDEQ